MLRFANPYYLYLLLLIPAFIAVLVVFLHVRKKTLQNLGERQLLDQLMPDYSPSRPIVKFIIFMLAFTLIILGLSRPQFGSKLVKMKRKGIELIVALDVSNSMNAEDIQPSRLISAKHAITKLVDRLEQDRIGLLVFAGDAFTQIPITSDYISAKMYLNTISSKIVPQQGTAIGKALKLAERSFTPETELKKVVVVITDGENHEDNPVEVAEELSKKGIIVNTIGIGSITGTPIPSSSNKSDFMKDKDGNVVVTKLDEKTLLSIAQAGGGIYVRANNTRFGLNKIIDELESLERKEYEANIYADYKEQFQYFFIPALFLLLLEFFLLDRKSKTLNRLKLFDID